MDKFLKYLALLIIATTTHFCFTTGSNLEHSYLCDAYSGRERIVGGRKADRELYKFMAGLIVKFGPILQCGCSIITTEWTITAAHCLYLLEDGGYGVQDIYISSGNKDWRKGFKHDVLNMISHEEYNNISMAYDVAIVRVKQPFNRNTEVPISLAAENYPYTPNLKIKVLGWGLHHSNATELQVELEEVDVSIFSQTECVNSYQLQGINVVDSQFCAGSPEGGKDACQFDSGGPILDKGILIGIVSWGDDCGKKGSPGVYTKVSILEKWLIKTSNRLGAPIKTVCDSRIAALKPFMRSSGSEGLKNIMMLILLQVLMVFIIK